MIFGIACKVLRKAHKLTQTELAEKLGVSIASVHSFEYGRRNSFEMLVTVCNYFQVPVWKAVKILEETTEETQLKIKFLEALNGNN